MITNEPYIGEGILGPGTYFRRMDNSLRYPEDLTGEDKPPYWYHAGWLGVKLDGGLYHDPNGSSEGLGIMYRSGDGYHTCLHHSVPGVVNMVRAGPRHAAAGSRVTIRVVGGGFDSSHVDSACIWLIKSDGDGTPTDKADRATDASGVEIPAEVVEFDPALATRYRALEMEFDLPTQCLL